jgi:hypothetical protein
MRNKLNAGLTVFTAMWVSDTVVVFWIVMWCGLVDCYQHSSKMLITPPRPHGVTTQKTTIGIFTAMRISNLSFLVVYQCFRGTLKMETTCSSEQWYTTRRLHSTTIQKTGTVQKSMNVSQEHWFSQFVECNIFYILLKLFYVYKNWVTFFIKHLLNLTFMLISYS